MNPLKKMYRLLNPRFQVLYPEYRTKFTPRYGHGKPYHKGLLSIMNLYRNNYEELLKQMTEEPLLSHLQGIGKDNAPLSPYWLNKFFPPFDMMVTYSMLSIYKPKLYIEVGSGNSTKVAALAVREQNLNTHITSIDPFPRAEIDELSDTIIRKPFETLDTNVLLSLQENDILFIDNSHRMFPNSDSTVFYLEVMPYLPKGVIVHIHDIFIPGDYSTEQCNRFYSEQYGLAIYLLSQHSRYQPISPNYFIYENPALQQLAAPLWDCEQTQHLPKHGVSFWLKIA